MAAALLCDLCGSEPGKYMVGDMDTGEQKSMGLQCFALVGFQVTMNSGDEYVDGILKPLGYAPTKALRDARKADQLPEFPANEPILSIVEDQPRPPGDESTSDQADESPDPLVDKAPDDGYTDAQFSTVTEANEAAQVGMHAADEDDADAPPY